ncbi:acetyl-CoA carboxylase biotin carboxyl carrier protein subunit [Zunongwangia sp. SCSIO 43204]|uniref:biotin/lipoyl-containing protein n=1 Tax=Zunongwangia sp. SCSIO 43204 TaxID=2779359 RepID=UPI001CA8204B|nr:acetyl-CoA carboxylase biotin carboxyl carrier protein subunit [Zunongwangia sp. SCSIO 43204]UAB83700.1 acetyl-CoA carboxylase biotin carboxyl carrier protein subunit [Zunongwangia sp. SCSIO 43204]
MEKKFKVKVNDTSEFEFTEDQILDLDIQAIGNADFHILHEHKSFKASVEKSDFLKRQYSIKINSNIYNINIANDLDLLIEKMGLSLGSAQLINDIKAPMPGLILEVNVEEGTAVKEGNYLLVLEAMKMENTITAPRDGVVKSIQIKKGETVEKNQLLIEME